MNGVWLAQEARDVIHHHGGVSADRGSPCQILIETSDGVAIVTRRRHGVAWVCWVMLCAETQPKKARHA
jgi:hypothetical protein